MTARFDQLERSFRAAETLLGLRITVIDNAHVFATPRGAAVFSAERRSHRKNPACEAGFGDGCIRHCRYAMNRRALTETEPFCCGCWKGLTQLVVPLHFCGVPYGMLYAGLWRSAEPPAGLPPEFLEARRNLPAFDPEAAVRLGEMMKLYAAGVMQLLQELHVLELPDERSAKIRSYLRETAAGNANLPELARRLGLSRSRASFVVRELFGRSFTELLRQERVERARQLFGCTDLTLKEIVPYCGFSDEFHLSRVFKQHTGMTPTEFRSKEKSS